MVVLYAVFFVLFLVPVVALFGFIIRGWLDVRFSLFRIAVAGMIAVFIGGPIITAMDDALDLQERSGWINFWFALLGWIMAVLAGVVFLVLAEALVPSNTLPGPLYTARATRRLIHRGARYWRIVRILFRRGLAAYLLGGRRAELRSPEGRATLATSMRLALNDGGVTFVKLGQILSTRRDLLPPEFIDQLSQLQDQAARVEWSAIESTLREDLGCEIDTVFSSFEREPLAAASIAQVHTATLRTGQDVVVKVRRPDITGQIERDLDIVAKLAGTIERSTEWGKNIGAVNLAEGFAVALREEIDLRVEARNIAIVAAAADARGGDPGIHIPVLYPELSSERVLVMERIRGIPLSAAGRAIEERGLDRQQLATSLLNSLLREIAIDGTFHADPHPGNVMLLEDGRLTLLDFGSVGRIDATLRSALIRLILAFNLGDPLVATDALLDLVERPEGLNEHRLERSLGQFMARYLTPGVPPDVRMFTDLFRIISTNGLSVPAEVAAVFRAIGTLEGTLTLVDPGYNMIGGARSFASDYLGEQLRPSALRKTLTDELTSLLPMLRRLPRRIDRIVGALEDGRLSVNVRAFAHEDDRNGVSGLVHEVLVTMLASTSGIMAVLLLGMDGPPNLTDTVSLYQFLGYILLVLAIMLAMRVLVLIFRPRRAM
jgi:ubiquinone biosynthesis protein